MRNYTLRTRNYHYNYYRDLSRRVTIAINAIIRIDIK